MQLFSQRRSDNSLWFVKGEVKVDLDKRNVNKMIQNKDLLEWILEITEKFWVFIAKESKRGCFAEDVLQYVFVHWGNDLRDRLVMQQEKGLLFLLE